MNKVIKFGADWCGPCNTMKSIYAKFAEIVGTSNADIIALNVDENPDEVTEYGVRLIPLIVFIKDGVVVDKISGVASIDILINKYKEVYETKPAKFLSSVNDK